MSLKCVPILILFAKVCCIGSTTPDCQATWQSSPDTQTSLTVPMLSTLTHEGCKAACVRLPFCVAVQLNDSTSPSHCFIVISATLPFLNSSLTFSRGATLYRLLRRCNPLGLANNITDDCASMPCKGNAVCQDMINGYRCDCHAGYSGSSCDRVPSDCADVKRLHPNALSGEYTVQISGQPQRVYCDMTTRGGGWLVIQRRKDGSENFYRPWNEYATGFGNISREFWIGNDKLAALTSTGRYGLRVDLEDKDEIKLYAEYENFTVGSASTNYKLINVGPYTGTAGDAMWFHINWPFSTYDQDNDGYKDSCAELMHGGWWYWDCYGANLNGQYNETTKERGVAWLTSRASAYSQKFVEMKIRPANF